MIVELALIAVIVVGFAGIMLQNQNANPPAPLLSTMAQMGAPYRPIVEAHPAPCTKELAKNLVYWRSPNQQNPDGGWTSLEGFWEVEQPGYYTNETWQKGFC